MVVCDIIIVRYMCCCIVFISYFSVVFVDAALNLKFVMSNSCWGDKIGQELSCMYKQEKRLNVVLNSY